MQALSKALLFSLAFIGGIQTEGIERRPTGLATIGSGTFDIGNAKDLEISVGTTGFYVTVVETNDAAISFPYEVRCSDASKSVDELYEIQVTAGAKASVSIKLKPQFHYEIREEYIIATLYVPKGMGLGVVDLKLGTGLIGFTNTQVEMDTFSTTVNTGTIAAQVSLSLFVLYLYMGFLTFLVDDVGMDRQDLQWIREDRTIEYCRPS